ncbi:MAG: nitroreductase family protein [Marinifilaceae bacterium]|nr:nitroreductase family protein [Marinifilaceae bacterium]
MLDFKIEEDKCIACSLCAQDCPVGIIEMAPKPVIRKEKEKNCLKCQHCLAICPTAALSILGKEPENSVLVSDEIPKPETISRLMKTRRSIRKYKKENIDKKLIQELIETAAHAPTGHNDNAVLISLIDNKNDLDLFRSKVYDSLKNARETGMLEKRFQFLLSYQKLWETKGVDVIFRDAPHLIIASAPSADASPMADCLISLCYFELIANSHGIGTLWNGMIKWAIDDIDPELRMFIGIPKDHTIGYVMLFGKPAVKYARGIQSEGLKVNRIKFE